jgi:hypothetical protein
MSKQHATDYSYEVIAQEDSETGDVLVVLPRELIGNVGWKIGDKLFAAIDKDGRWIVTKKN